MPGAHQPQYGDVDPMVETAMDSSRKILTNEYRLADVAGDRRVTGRLKRSQLTRTAP